MTPPINVNMKPCNCLSYTKAVGTHATDCAATPILIPCLIPLSVTFTVTQGECTCAIYARVVDGGDTGHTRLCPARPIHVTCSIGGETWEGSEIKSLSGYPDTIVGAARDKLFDACRERWALVKALVTGQPHELAIRFKTWCEMVDQRDAVFAALADKVRAELADDAATREIVRLVPGLRAPDIAASTARDYLSVVALSRYISHLISLIGAL